MKTNIRIPRSQVLAVALLISFFLTATSQAAERLGSLQRQVHLSQSGPVGQDGRSAWRLHHHHWV